MTERVINFSLRDEDKKIVMVTNWSVGNL